MELSFAENAGLKTAKISTGAGSPVELTPANAGKAVEAAKVVGTGNDLKLKIDYATKADGVYPIVLVTYEIACDKGNDPAKLALLKSFLGYTASADGQKAISGLGYAPLPELVRQQGPHRRQLAVLTAGAASSPGHRPDRRTALPALL